MEPIWALGREKSNRFGSYCRLSKTLPFYQSSWAVKCSGDRISITTWYQQRFSGMHGQAVEKGVGEGVHPAGLSPFSPQPHPNISQHKHPDWVAVWERGKQLTFSSHQKLAVTSCQWEVITRRPHTVNLVLKSCFPVKFKSGQQFWKRSRCLLLLRIWAQECSYFHKKCFRNWGFKQISWIPACKYFGQRPDNPH